MEDIITIKVWSDTNANIHSKNTSDMEVDREEWEGMNEKQRSEYVLEYLWGQEMLDFGWDDSGEEE